MQSKRLVFDSFQLLSLLFRSKASFGSSSPPAGVLARGLNFQWNYPYSTSHHSTWPDHCFASNSRRRAWWRFAAIRDAQGSLRSRLWLCNWSNDEGLRRRLRVDHLNFRRNTHLLFGARCLCHRFDGNFLFRWIGRIVWRRKRRRSGLPWGLAGGPRPSGGRSTS